MIKKLLASSSGNKNGSSNIYMNGKEIYKIYQGKNLVYDVWNGRDFNYEYNYRNQKFTFTDWKQTLNGEPNTTHLIVNNDNTIVFKRDTVPKNTVTHIEIPEKVSMESGNMWNMFHQSKTLQYANIRCHDITSMNTAFARCYNLTGPIVCGNNVVDMVSAYSYCNKLSGSPICGPNVKKMDSAYFNCTNLTGSPVCGNNVNSMIRTYENCTNLTGSPVCGTNVNSMAMAYKNCRNLTGSPVCGNKVTDMYHTYYNCRNLTGSPVCGNNVTNMSSAYDDCFNLTGSPVCGPNVINMRSTYYGCYNLTGSPVCGDKVTDMAMTYYYCYNITGSPVCGTNVTNMGHTYSNCSNLTGSPVCGPKVTNMASTYLYCNNITGSPVCGDNVTTMFQTYSGCHSLTGSPVCGDNVTTIELAYCDCYNITGSPVCGDKVTSMSRTYMHCYNLTGAPICGPNVTIVGNTYYNCTNLSSNGYFYSNNINSVRNCFGGRNKQNRLNLYVFENSTTLNTCLITDSSSLVGQTIAWTNDTTTNNCYYNTTQNIYIYPVANVADVYRENELKIATYSMDKDSNVLPYSGKTMKTVTINIEENNGTPVLLGYVGTDVDTIGSDLIVARGFECWGIYEGETSVVNGQSCTLYHYFNWDTYESVYIEYHPNTKSIYFVQAEASDYGFSYEDVVITLNKYTTMDVTIKDVEYDDYTTIRTIYAKDGTMPNRILFENNYSLYGVDYLDISNVTDASDMFRGCSQLESINISNWDTSKITKADYMFAYCSRLHMTYLEEFELPNVTSAAHIFDGFGNDAPR